MNRWDNPDFGWITGPMIIGLIVFGIIAFFMWLGGR